MIGVRRPDLAVARVRREINVAGFAFRSSVSWLLPQSQLAAGHHRSRRDGLRQKKHNTKKNSIVTQSVTRRRLRLDHEPPLSCCFGVGVAGFEPTASSSRSNNNRVLTSAFQRV